MKVGDRVQRKMVNSFRYHRGKGTIVELKSYDRFYIKWDDKASTGQQHSTIQGRFLKLVPLTEKELDQILRKLTFNE